MARIFRFSGYAVDPNDDFEDKEDFGVWLNNAFDCNNVFSQQLRVDESEEFEWDDTLPENQVNCDLQYLENRFKCDINDRTSICSDYDEDYIYIGGIYRHFKGKIVKVIAVSRHSETGETSVVYICENGKVFNRPIDMFCSKVDKEKYPDVKQKERFEYVGMFE